MPKVNSQRAGFRPWIRESLDTPIYLLTVVGIRLHARTGAWDDQPVWMKYYATAASCRSIIPQEVNEFPSIVARKDGRDRFCEYDHRIDSTFG